MTMAKIAATVAMAASAVPSALAFVPSFSARVATALSEATLSDAVAPEADAIAPEADAIAPEADAVAPEADEAPAAPVPAVFAGGLVGGDNVEPMPFNFQGAKNAKNFDPLGFTEKSPELVPWFREAELKHSRMAMLACVGFVVPEYVRVPGPQFSFEAVPNVLDAHDALIDTSMKQILLWVGLLEAISIGALSNMPAFDREPGDFSFDPLGLMPTDPVKADEMRLKELKNGRLAMVGLGGMIHGAIATGHGFPYI